MACTPQTTPGLMMGSSGAAAAQLERVAVGVAGQLLLRPLVLFTAHPPAGAVQLIAAAAAAPAAPLTVAMPEGLQ